MWYANVYVVWKCIILFALLAQLLDTSEQSMHSVEIFIMQASCISRVKDKDNRFQPNQNKPNKTVGSLLHQTNTFAVCVHRLIEIDFY